MDSQGNIIPMNEESIEAAKRLNEILVEIPQEELEDVVRMNRAQRRAWRKAALRRRGRGFTR